MHAVTAFQRLVAGITAVLVAFRVFLPVRYWAAIGPRTDVSTTLLQVLGILVLGERRRSAKDCLAFGPDRSVCFQGSLSGAVCTNTAGNDAQAHLARETIPLARPRLPRKSRPTFGTSAPKRSKRAHGQADARHYGQSASPSSRQYTFTLALCRGVSSTCSLAAWPSDCGRLAGFG